MEEKFVYMTEAQVAERKAKIDAIEGLAELRAARNDAADAGPDTFLEAFRKYDELRVKYPRARAYLVAEHLIREQTPIEVRLGSRAMDKILNGEDPEAVIQEMRQGLDAFLLAQQGD